MDKNIRIASMNAIDGSAMMADLETISQWQKYPGTPEEMESLRYLEARARSFGMRTQILLHDAYISLPGRASIEVPGDAMDCITHSFSLSTPPDGLRGRLVYVGKATPAELAGKELAGCIAVVDGLATPASATRLTAAGAAGQLNVSPDEHRHEMTLSPVWGSPGAEDRRRMPTTAACTVSRGDGQRIKDRLAAGEDVEIAMHAEVATGWRKIPILLADLVPEHGEGDRYVLFSGHHDTWHYGVMDNGTANVTMLEVARVAALHKRHLRRGLRLAFWSGHSQGRYAGSAWYADEFWSDLERNCVLHVNIDSTGGRDNNDFVSLSGSEFWATAEAAMAGVSGEPVRLKHLGRFGDQSFWGIGVPAVLAFGEQPPSSEMHQHFPHPLGWWWHTEGDTLDKIDADILVRDARFYANIVLRALCDAVLPIDFAVTARELEGELKEIAAKLADRLDLAGLCDRSARLAKLLDSLAEAGRTAAEANADAINNAIVGVSRAIVPLQFTSGDRFEPDPALQQPYFPALGGLRNLCATPAGDEDGYSATVDAMRCRNRIAHALDRAIDTAEGCLRQID